ncbi:MAG: bifunctional UDP-N-acetylmuramoyl-tripeptide:D-alanyl-D-alanine ligase/alanine racemase [Dysgonamonadaceae bacterium]|jgi:alanine racemase|nr:bifunctional UDP-N-acetylmuramoyl-tripeptide:D-alanyl-D-alanine ligase/alanine racemase [Dysgonamonadaceae bacterium]
MNRAYSLQSIHGIISAKGHPPGRGIRICTLLTDSRNFSDAAGTLFFALRTVHNDGHRYIGELIARGVRNFVIQYYLPEFDQCRHCHFLVVPDTLAALQKLAAHHRRLCKAPVVGITGSNGKTVVKEWLYQLLNGSYNIVRSPRSYNSQIGVPLSVWQLERGAELGIFEAGISQPGEMKRLEEIIMPDVGILTNVGYAHQEYFTSVEQKIMEKLVFFKNCKVMICWGDDSAVMKGIEQAGIPPERICFWSREKMQTAAFLYIHKVRKIRKETIIDYVFKGTGGKITIPFIDDASIENAINCLTAILYLQPGSLPDVLARFAFLEPVEMRLDVKAGINNCILINDTYNSDVHSLEIALDFVVSRRSTAQENTTVILSDILQSGIDPFKLYWKIVSLIMDRRIQRVIGIGTDLMEYAYLFEMQSEFYPSTEAFLQSMHPSEHFRDEIILIKGSRSFHFEKISERLEAKVHETILEVNLDAIVHNFNYFRSKLRPSTKMVCMIKAFGYGVGAYELARTLQNRRCDYLAVAVADEGADLRMAGITLPIIVMNPEMHSFDTLFRHQLEPEIYSFRLMDAFIREAERRGITSWPVHLKVDTGMHRLGFSPDDAERIILRLEAQKSIKVRSVFSHLAGSDTEALDEYTERQVACLNAVAERFARALPYPFLRHILNSAGIERFPQYRMDMVRLGIGLYGIPVVEGQDLQVVATLRSTILQIRELKAGETVGYNRNGVLQRDSRIACIPIGYADGMDRRLGNGGGVVYVNGVMCPVVGNVSMDVTLIDVTDADAVEGDSVIIFGKEIPVQAIADRLGTIPYEILTSISPRVKRVYFRE